jgi:ABC transporter ATM
MLRYLTLIFIIDIIHVLQDGKVVEFGRHEELLLIENSVYKNMWNKQESLVGHFNEVNRHDEEFNQKDHP